MYPHSGVLAAVAAAPALLAAACTGGDSRGNARDGQPTMATGPWTTGRYSPRSAAVPALARGFACLPWAGVPSCGQTALFLDAGSPARVLPADISVTAFPLDKSGQKPHRKRIPKRA
jgi:hypothetical protein